MARTFVAAINTLIDIVSGRNAGDGQPDTLSDRRVGMLAQLEQEGYVCQTGLAPNVVEQHFGLVLQTVLDEKVDVGA